MWIFKAIKWMIENWLLVLAIITMIIIFSVTSGITKAIRNVKEGIKESMTPLGGFVLLVIIGLVVIIIYSIMRVTS